jgi:hypothetical protein
MNPVSSAQRVVLAVLGAGAILLRPWWEERQEVEQLLQAVRAGNANIVGLVPGSPESASWRRAVPGLLSLLSDPDPRVAAAAFQVLLRLDPRAAAAAPCEPHFNPGSIPPVGVPVGPETPLAPGDFVEIQWGSQWWAGRVVRLEPQGRVWVHYLGWDPTNDEVVPRERLHVLER